MVARNDVTGDAIVNIPKRSPSVVVKPVVEETVFEIFNCKRCHIKVSTSNKKCPCCGEDLPNE